MESRLDRARSIPRQHRAYRRAALAGGLLGGALFVAAQAGPLDFIQLEFAQVSKNAPGKPVEAEAQRSGGASGADASNSSARGPQDAQAAASVGRQAAAQGQMVEIDWPASGEEETDGSANSLDLLGLAPLQAPAGSAAWQSQPQFGSAFRPAMASNGRPGGFGLAAPASPASRRTPEGQPASCCTDPAAQEKPLQPLQNEPLLSGPIPEPTTWMTLILGVGLSGLMLRARRRRWA